MKRLFLSFFISLSFIATAQRRIGIQDYSSVASLQAETLTPQQNDKVFIKATKYLYTWDNASTATHDGINVIKQTNIATGRFLLISTDLSSKANIASPTFTGTPTAPTATAGTNTTQIATTAFVQSEISTKTGFFTIAQIRAFNSGLVTANPRVYMTDSGKEGFWYYNASGTSGDNTGTRIITSSGAYYYRVTDGYIRPEWFGAVRNGITDDAQAINAAILAGNKLFLSPGSYGVASTILINKSSFELVGSGKFTTIIKPISSFSRITDSCLVRIGSSAFRPSNVTVKNVSIAATYGSDGNNLSGLLVDADYNTDILNCWFQGGNYINRNVAGVHIAKAKHLRFTDCNFTNSYSYAVYVSGQCLDDTQFLGCQFDESQADIIINATGYFQDVKIQNCSFGHSYDALGVNNTPYRLIQIKNLVSGGINNMLISNCTFSNTSSSPTLTGIDILGGVNVKIENCRFENYKRYAIIRKGSGKIYISNNYFYNNGRTRSDSNYANGTNNSETSPYQTDIFWDSGYYGGTIENNVTDQSVTAWVESNISDVQYLNAKFINNRVYSHKRIFGETEKGISAPTNGALNYLKGEFVENNNPSELGSTPNKYVISGWRCIISGFPGTWVQVRNPTGN